MWGGKTLKACDQVALRAVLFLGWLTVSMDWGQNSAVLIKLKCRVLRRSPTTTTWFCGKQKNYAVQVFHCPTQHTQTDENHLFNQQFHTPDEKRPAYSCILHCCMVHWWEMTLQTWFNEGVENFIKLRQSQILQWKNYLMGWDLSWRWDKHRQFQVYNHIVKIWHITATDHIHILQHVRKITDAVEKGRDILCMCLTVMWSITRKITFSFNSAAPICKLIILLGNQSPGPLHNELRCS